MKIVGILTFHYVDNYGAVLQTWALKKIIESCGNYKADIINYVPTNYKILTYDSSEEAYDAMINKRKSFEHFLEYYCNIQSPIVNKVVGNEYDYYCVGSDQVWNLSLNENQEYEYLFPNLDKKAKRFSYAPSLGGKIREQDIDIFKKNLKDFSKISVREKDSISELSEITNLKIENVLDPTLLLSKNEYEKIIVEPKRIIDNYIFFFSYPIGEINTDTLPFVNFLSQKTGLDVLHSLTNVNEKQIVNNLGSMMYEGIGEFLWYMRNASIIVTTSYHGLIFAEIFNKPVYVVLPTKGKERLLNLVDILGYHDRVVDNNYLFKKFNKENHFVKCKNKLQNMKENSLNFISEALNS